MASNYPTSLDDGTTLPEPTTGATIPAADDTNRSDAIKELEAKVGIGASTPTDGTVLKGTGVGTSAFGQVDVDELSATGTPDSSTFLRGDGTWSAPAGSGDMLAATYDPTTVMGDAFDADNHVVSDTNFDVIVGTSTQAALDSTDELLLNARSTGVIYGGEITINAGDSSKVDVSAAQGVVLDNTDPENPVHYSVSYAGATAITLVDTVSPITYWYLDNSGILQQTTSIPTRSQQRTRIYLGRTAFGGGAVLATVSMTTPVQQVAEQLSDLIDFLDMLKSGLNPSNAGTDLTIQISAGEIFDHGANFWNDATDPHVKALAATDPTTFQMATQNGGTGSDVTALDVGNYDVAGTITAIPGGPNASSIFTVYKFPTTETVRIQYGNTTYSSVVEAEEALQTGLHSVTVPPVFNNAVVLGYIITTRTETDLSNASFTSTNLFGELGGGVSGLTGTYLEVSNNLSDLLDASAARANLGLTIGTDVQPVLAEGAFVDGDKTILDDLPVSNLANGTDGELITWNSAGEPTTVSTGTSGQVLTSNGAGAEPTFQAPAGGGGGQTLYDAVLDSGGGGDYTDWSTAMAALTAGQSLFVRSGTYTETSALAETTAGIRIIGENKYNTVLQLNSTSNSGWSGDDITFSNVTLENTNTGRWQFQGDRQVVDDCIVKVSGSATSFAFQFTGDNSGIQNSIYTDTAASDDRRVSVQGSNDSGFFNNNQCKITNNSNSTTIGVIDADSIRDCHIYVTTTSTSGAVVISGQSVVGDNYIDGNSTSNALGIYGNAAVVTGNRIRDCRDGISLAGSGARANSNKIEGNGTGFGIRLGGSVQSAIGNHINLDNTSATGVELGTASDNCVINSNTMDGLNVGVLIPAATNNNNVVTGNGFLAVTTDISDSGTGTITDNNAS